MTGSEGSASQRSASEPSAGAPAPAPARNRFTAVVCTRDRPDSLARTLAALDRQARRDFPILVVDQSQPPDARLERRAAQDRRLTLIRDGGRGLSRARNIGARHADTEWVAFVDDDCVPEPDWAECLDAAVRTHPEADIVAGHVEAPAPSGHYVPVAPFSVSAPRLRAGRFVHPGLVGFGVSMAVRRSAIERVGGWDERLGPGAPRFPAADDMDFNYRLLRSGSTAYLTPDVRARHEQWRSLAELPPLYRGYLTAWSAMAMKHLRTGDVRGGARLWLIGALDVIDMAASAVRRRSRLRGRIAWAKLIGLAAGTARGLRTSW